MKIDAENNCHVRPSGMEMSCQKFEKLFTPEWT